MTRHAGGKPRDELQEFSEKLVRDQRDMDPIEAEILYRNLSKLYRYDDEPTSAEAIRRAPR